MKALVGSWDTAPHKLLAELTALRSKVAQLKTELEELRSENAMLRELASPSPSVSADVVADKAAHDKALASTSA